MKTLIIPGLDGSGPGHWQDWWLCRDRNAVLVAQTDWRRPDPHAWAARLVEMVQAHPYSWLVAHSLGAALVARVAAERLDLCVAGALLVAPADTDAGVRLTERIGAFAPMPLAPLPFPATVVASRTDPAMQFRRARMFAAAWGARLVDYGDAGHINAASGFGSWPEGPRLLAELQGRRRRPVDIAPAPARRLVVAARGGAYV